MKKPKTGLEMLQGNMFNIPVEKRQMSIREKAEQKMRLYMQEPSPFVDVNVLE